MSKFKEYLNSKGNVSKALIVAILAIVVLVVVINVFAVILPYDISKSITTLENSGYVVFSASEYATIKTELDDILEETRHTSYIWPEATNLTATVIAPVTSNVWGEWTEITDSAGNKLSDKITGITHFSDTKIESYSDKNQEYMYQIAYGDSKVIVGGRRVSPIKESGEYAIDLKSLPVPIGEKIYYRCMCSVGGEYCTVLFRYHYHVR